MPLLSPKANRQPRYRTARAVIHHDGGILLAVHSSFWRSANRRWGLPGGGIEWRESPEDACRRELREELDVHVSTLNPVGDFQYKGYLHRVFHTEFETRHVDYDDNELLAVEWFSVEDIARLSTEHKLHAGYELRAVQQALGLPLIQ